MSDRYKALWASEQDGKVTVSVTELGEKDLPDGDVTVAVRYSTVNYKDGLAVQGNKSKIMRALPMAPGIDYAGVVEQSSHADFKAGEEVVLTGWGVGERHSGGYAQRTRAKGDWLVHKPEGLSLQQSMAIGTAGFTAMLCVMELAAQDVRPDAGEVLVTGAAGGVGSVAVALLAARGYRVVASTGRPEQHDYLRELGAVDFVGREELSQPGRPLGSERWAGAVDTVGSQILANILAGVRYGGTVAACGLAAGTDLPATVLPFILRGARLSGIDSVYCPKPKRTEAWQHLAKELPLDKLDRMTTVRPLADVPEVAAAILAGKVRGRTVIDVNA